MLKNPKKIKFKKLQRSSLKKINRIKSYVKFQQKPIQFIARVSSIIRPKQIEAVRKLISRKLKLISKFSIQICADLPLTAKPTAMRMGKGKGNFKEWIGKIKAGTLIFKFENPYKSIIQSKLNTNYNKFPFKLKLI